MRKRKKKIFSLFLAIAVLLSSIAIPDIKVQAEDSNVALGKTVTVSSVEAAVPGNTGDQTVDGDRSTRWSSEAMKSSTTTDADDQTPQWLIIDLEAEKTNVTEISISFFKKVWATKYEIQTADTNTNETEWETVKSTERASGSLADDPTDAFTDVTALKRYVRFYFDKINVQAGGTGVSVTEIAITGSAAEVSPEPDTPDPVEVKNVALEKGVTVSSVEAAMPGNTGNQAVDGNNDGMLLTYSSTRAGIVDKSMTPLVADAIYEATLVPQENGARFGLIMRATDESHKVLVGTENSNNQWFWEYWNGDAQKWSAKFTGPALEVGKEITVRVKLVGKNATLWVNGTEVFSETLTGNPLLEAGYFGFDKCNNAGSYLIKEMSVTAINSASGELHKISQLPEIGIDDTQVNLPEVAEGYELKVIGSTKEQVISNDGGITSHNIGDREVTLLVEMKNTEDETDTARRNFTVTVPSKNSKYPEIFKAVENANEKPKVIPSLQEWYGYDGTFTLSSDSKIVINDLANVGLQSVAENMQSDLKEICRATLPIVQGSEAGAHDIYIESLSADTYEVGEEGYFMTINESGIRIYAGTYTGCLYGTITVEQILWQDEENANVPFGVIRDYPDYEIRGVMFDVGRIPHRLQYLKDYTKILTWYKMSEFHLHLNDDFNYNADGLPINADLWSGMHRLESDTFPSLTEKQVYAGDKFKYFNEEYADPTYTKEEFRELEALANSRGIDLIAEFDTPSHSTAYIEYAAQNPDNIEWLGEINTTTSSAANNRQMLALDINSANATEKQHALNARKFITELYADYLGGDQPVFTSSTVHVGADEYWDKSNPEAFRKYVVFLSDLMASYGKTARMWGAQLLFPGETEISPDNIVLDVWATYEEDPNARLAEGYRVVNVPQPYLYTTPGRDHKDMIGEEYLYKNWNPLIFNGDVQADPGEPLLLGAKAALWGDEFREGITEADTHERMLRAVAMTAEKTWGGQTEEDSYIEYQMAFEELQEGPGTEIAHTVESVTETVVDYDLMNVEETADGLVVKDASGNAYDALVTNGKVVTVDGETMIAFDGSTLMTTPLTTLDYPYTVSFDIRAAEGNTSDSLLFSGYDGQLRAKGLSDNEMTIKRSLYTQSTGVEIPTDQAVNVTIVGTFQNTKIYVDGELVKMLQCTETGSAEEYWSTFVFPMEEIGKNFHGYLANIKAYNKALQPEMIRSDAENITEINVALNAEAYAERFGGSPALNTGDLKRHPAWKATDGDKADPEAAIASTDKNSYWLSSNNDNDYLMADLGETRNVSKVAVTWDGNRYAAAFAIEVSEDGRTWNRVQTVENNTASENVITLNEPVAAQFVKVQGITRNSDYYAIRELEVFEQVDRTSLKEQIAEAEKVIAEDELSTSDLEEAKSLLEAFAASGKIFQNPLTTTSRANESAETLKAALAAYQKAKEDLDKPDVPPVPVVDKKDLNAAIKKAEALEKDGYTTDSWNTLLEALESAKEAAEDEKVSQAIVDERTEALKDAIDNLKASTPDKPSEGDKPSDDDKPSEGNKPSKDDKTSKDDNTSKNDTASNSSTGSGSNSPAATTAAATGDANRYMWAVSLMLLSGVMFVLTKRRKQQEK